MSKLILKKLAKQILKFRKELDITQEELALKTGISRSTIAMIETAKRDVTISKLAKISKALKISVSDLVNF